MTRDSAAFLRHILLCLSRIGDYTKEGSEVFFRDTKTQDAVIRNLEIIGQAVRDLGVDQLSSEFPSAIAYRNHDGQCCLWLIEHKQTA